MVNGIQPLIIFAKGLILDIWLGSDTFVLFVFYWLFCFIRYQKEIRFIKYWTVILRFTGLIKTKVLFYMEVILEALLKELI